MPQIVTLEYLVALAMTVYQRIVLPVMELMRAYTQSIPSHISYGKQNGSENNIRLVL